MNEYVFKITLKQQLCLLIRVFFIWPIIIFIILYIFNLDLSDTAALGGMLFLFVLDTLPALILHIQYLLKNSNAIIMINTQNEEFNYQGRKKEFNYRFDDIVSFDYYRNYGNPGAHAFAQYRYYKLRFRDDKEIIITCLMINQIEKTFEPLIHLKPQVHGSFFNLIQTN